MKKEFKSIAELVQDPNFVQYVKDEILDIQVKRMKRPEPKPGFRYVRDYYDRMTSENMLNADFFLKNIEAIWNKKSSLSSEKRKIIQFVCDVALYKTHDYYKSIDTIEKKIPKKNKKIAVVEDLK